ncbi:MAG: molybdopterin-dependent oxidoreductase [Sedimentibacter sp.]|uniref:molybdopterin-dependent oxidoreductase n=1 Tax=Sedimentibacter sp. TaxID=1960295 RepID=UPI00315825FA
MLWANPYNERVAMKHRRACAIIFTLSILVLASCSQEKTSLMIKKGNQKYDLEKSQVADNENCVAFSAVVRSSGEKPVEAEFRGLEMTILLTSLGIDIHEASKITFSASDGYRVAMKTEEVMEPGNVYIAFERDGEAMRSKKQGGSGPYQLIIRKDPFSQRWVKHVDEIVIE